MWIFFLIFLPILTSLVYLIARGREMTERNVHAVQAAQKHQEAYIRRSRAAERRRPTRSRAPRACSTPGAISAEEFERLKAKALA